MFKICLLVHLLASCAFGEQGWLYLKNGNKLRCDMCFRDNGAVLVQLRNGIMEFDSSEIRRIKLDAPPRSGAGEQCYDRLIATYASLEGLDPAVVKAVISVESDFNPRAVSPKGAMGLMQIMPETAGALGAGDIFDPEGNIKAGTAYLACQLEVFGSLERALIAYCAGPNVAKRIKPSAAPGEIKSYISKVRKYRALYRADFAASSRGGKYWHMSDKKTVK